MSGPLDGGEALAARPWAFWAPSSEDLIEQALDLAGVGPGTRFLDLGCGDGRVLVAAALRGAEVRGVEVDPALAGRARRSLEEAGVPGTVELGDMFAASLDADVIYAYLTPVTLHRLRGRLSGARPGTRVVTPRYGFDGWEPARSGGGCHLYELPAPAAASGHAPGWPWRAVVLSLPPDRRVLVPLTFVARPGPLGLDVDRNLAEAASYAAGECAGDEPAPVPVDLIFSPHGAGSVFAGPVVAQGAELAVAAVFSDAAPGHWGFAADEGQQFRDLLDETISAARQPR